MISRLLGFVRDILIASLLGASAVADVFFVAFRFPNLFRRIFAEGAFNSAFIPLFAKKLEQDGRSRARYFAEEAMALLLVTLLLLLAVAEISMPWLIYAIAPGFSDNPEKLSLAVLLTRIAFPYLLFISIVALLSGVLNALGRFAAAAAAPIMLNVVLIAVMSLAILFGVKDKVDAAILLCWGVFAAGVVQLLLLVFAVQREGMVLDFKLPRFSPDMKQLVMLGIPGILVGGVTQINSLVGTIIASAQESAVSWLWFADRVYQLPLGIVGIAIGVVLLPDLSRRLKSGDMRAVHNSQNRSLEFALFLTLPASVALFVAPEPIIRVLFERGAFMASDSQATAWALAAFAWGLPSFVMIKVFSPAFFAREDTKTPMRYASAGMLANMVLSFVLFYFIGHVGIAIATTISGWITAGLLWHKLYRLGHYRPDNQLRRTVGPIILSSIMMGCLIWAGLFVFGHYFAPDKPFSLQAVSLTVLVAGGLMVYVLLAHFTGALHIPTFLRTVTGRNRA